VQFSLSDPEYKFLSFCETVKNGGEIYAFVLCELWGYQGSEYEYYFLLPSVLVGSFLKMEVVDTTSIGNCLPGRMFSSQKVVIIIMLYAYGIHIYFNVCQ
jgi:hypothetical protein